MSTVDRGRSHLSGIVSWPPASSVESHLNVLARIVLESFRSGTVLDAGCGDGGLARTLAGLNPNLHIIGLDIEPHPLWKVPCPPNLRFALGSLDRAPVKYNEFDYVVVKDVLHHLPDPRGSFPEIARYARKGILVIEANRYNPISYVWMVRIAKHDHFSRRKLRWVLNTGLPIRAVETHVWPKKLELIGKTFERLVNKFRPLSGLANYNFVFIPVDPEAVEYRAR